MYSDPSVKIEMADNGVVVTACQNNDNGPPDESTYVYPTLEKAMAEVPAIFKKLQGNAMPDVKNEGDLQNMEASINKKMPPQPA